MADTVKDMEFRILYRKKGMKKSETCCFTAASPEKLLHVLARVEDISKDTCDLLVIHGYDGPTTIEVMCHEPKEVEGSDRDNVVVPMSATQQEQIINATFDLLRRGRETALALEQPESTASTALVPVADSKMLPTRLQVTPKSRGVAMIAGFNIVAYPARNHKEAEAYVSSD